MKTEELLLKMLAGGELVSLTVLAEARAADHPLRGLVERALHSGTAMSRAELAALLFWQERQTEPGLPGPLELQLVWEYLRWQGQVCLLVATFEKRPQEQRLQELAANYHFQCYFLKPWRYCFLSTTRQARDIRHLSTDLKGLAGLQELGLIAGDEQMPELALALQQLQPVGGQEEKPAEKLEIPGLPPLIITIDDSPFVTRTLQLLLEKQGYRVQTANDSHKGLELCLVSVPDLIITDVNMPGLNGFQLVEKLRQQGIQTPIVMLTSKHTEEDVRLGYQAGVDQFVLKPFDYQDLCQRIEKLIKP